MWFDAEIEDDDREKVFLANASAVATNYINAAVDRFVMSLCVRDMMHLDAIRNRCESHMAVMSAAWFVEFRQRLPWLLHVD